MNINIAVLARLQFIPRHKKFAVQLFIQLIEDQAALRCNQCTIRVCIALVTNVADRLTLRVDIIHHVNEIHFVVAVIAVALGNCRIH